MAGEQDLLNRWTLSAESPKEIAALNLAVQRAKLMPGYKLGQSAPEMELKARQADLADRQRAYIDDQNAQHARELATQDPVSNRMAPEVDFSTKSPYLTLASPKRGYEHGGIGYGLEPGENEPLSAGRGGAGGGSGAGTGRPVTRAQTGKNFDDFQSAVHDLAGDQLRARTAGQANFRRKTREQTEQAARMRGVGPLDAVKFNRDVQPETMTRGGQAFDVPRGGHFDDEAAFGPRVGVGAPVAASPSISPETPVGDGDLSNDDVQGEPDFDYRAPSAPRVASQAASKAYPYFRDTAPTYYDSDAEHGGVSAETARAGASRAIAAPREDTRDLGLFISPDEQAERRRTNAIPDAVDYIYQQPTTELRGVARQQVFDELSPTFTDRRKPQSAALPPSTTPVAHRAY